MPQYDPGVPLWVDVSSPDLDRTRTFYGDLFGWEATPIPDPAAGGYTMFFRDGKTVAAAAPTMNADQHPAWSTYVCSADAEATVNAAREAGGQVVMEPMDVLGQGRMAALQDPTGAHVLVWEPQIHQGADLVNEPGSFCWNELYTRDMPAARDFYARTFGWGVEESDFEGGKYTLFQVNGRNIAGGLDMRSLLPDTIPPHWLVYFAVANAADTVQKARDLGATILQEPKDTPMGPIAVIEDPVGAAFAIIQVPA